MVPRTLGKPDMSYVEVMKLPGLQVFDLPSCTMYVVKNAQHLPINEKATKLYQLGVGSKVRRIHGDAILYGIPSNHLIDHICDQYIQKSIWARIRNVKV